MARVLPVTLVQTKKAMAFAAKEIDRIDNLDAMEYRCPLAQPSKFFLSDSIDSGQQIDDTKWSLLESQYSKLPVGWRKPLNQSAAFCL